jgi:hypothetical protein
MGPHHGVGSLRLEEVEMNGRADQCEMREPLRKVAEKDVALRIDLF